ncbi:MAG: HNH endonuclease [Gemmatimonadota bacterium]
MGRPSGSRAKKRQHSSTLRTELQRQIERGQCAYCRAPARPDSPLTREHVIPRARGGRRKDVRIIVPACARCNQHRGCREFIPFLLARPRRISSFLDYLCVLSPECLREIDPRIYAELYVAVAIIAESSDHGAEWRREMRRLCSGRALHRRRYAARRAVGAVTGRIEKVRDRDGGGEGPSCVLPELRSDLGWPVMEEPLERIASRLLSLLALQWEVSGAVVERELARELSGTAVGGESLVGGTESDSEAEGRHDEEVLKLDGWIPRPKRRRLRVDRRNGRGARTQRRPPVARGRAA